MTEVSALAKLREPFAANHISKLPKPTKAQTEAVRADFKKGVRCKECGAWHHPDVVHLDYVGHAALTDRLLDTDPHWSWEPVAFTEGGLPAFDQTGGLWIRLTVCGVTRLGYGHAAAKPQQDPGSREKEVIGDALRNAGMRFGAALDLWHKGDLHADEPTPADDRRLATIDAAQCAELRKMIARSGATEESFCDWLKVGTLPELEASEFTRAKNALAKKIEANLDKRREDPKRTVEDILDDQIPY